MKWFFQINHVVFLSNNKDFGTDLKNKEVKPITSNTRQQKIPVILVLPLKQCKSRQTKHYKLLNIVWGPPGRWETGYLISVMKPLFIPANKLLQKVKVSVFCWIKKKKKKIILIFIILVYYSYSLLHSFSFHFIHSFFSINQPPVSLIGRSQQINLSFLLSRRHFVTADRYRFARL